MSQHELKKTEGHQNNSAFAYYRGYGSMSRLSVEQQRDSAASYAKEHDLQIVEEYMDINGLGKAADCPEFQRMMAEISVSRPSTLFVYKRSSMSRNIEEYIHALKTVEAAGCSIVFTAEMEPDTDSLTGKLWDLLLAYEER